MYESEKARAEMLEKSLRENESLKRASELEEEVLRLREENHKLKAGAESGAADSDIEQIKNEYASLKAEKEALEDKLNQMKELAIAALGEKDAVIEEQREKISELKVLFEKQIETSAAEIKELEEKVYSLEKQQAPSFNQSDSFYSRNDEALELKVLYCYFMLFLTFNSKLWQKPWKNIKRPKLKELSFERNSRRCSVK